ncbi:MAG: hypothetical protein ABI599_14410 [Flavobacteriales bacterium]
MALSAIGILLLHTPVRPAHVHLSLCAAGGSLTWVLLPAMLCSLPGRHLHRILERHYKHRFRRELYTAAHFVHGAYHQPFYCYQMPVQRSGALHTPVLASDPDGLHLHFRYPLPKGGLPPAPTPLIVPYYKATLVKCVHNAHGDGTHLRHYPTDTWLPLLPHRGLLVSAGLSACGRNYEVVVRGWVPEGPGTGLPTS